MSSHSVVCSERPTGKTGNMAAGGSESICARKVVERGRSYVTRTKGRLVRTVSGTRSSVTSGVNTDPGKFFVILFGGNIPKQAISVSATADVVLHGAAASNRFATALTPAAGIRQRARSPNRPRYLVVDRHRAAGSGAGDRLSLRQAPAFAEGAVPPGRDRGSRQQLHPSASFAAPSDLLRQRARRAATRTSTPIVITTSLIGAPRGPARRLLRHQGRVRVAAFGSRSDLANPWSLRRRPT